MKPMMMVVISGALAGLGLALSLNAGAQTSGTEQTEAEAKADRSPAKVSRLGFRSFLKCRSCHTLKVGERHLVGPNLAGFLDQPAATKADYAYSAALTSAELLWDDDTLRRWLENPSAVVANTKMVFEGIDDDTELDALILYLQRETVK